MWSLLQLHQHLPGVSSLRGIRIGHQYAACLIVILGGRIVPGVWLITQNLYAVLFSFFLKKKKIKIRFKKKYIHIFISWIHSIHLLRTYLGVLGSGDRAVDKIASTCCPCSWGGDNSFCVQSLGGAAASPTCLTSARGHGRFSSISFSTLFSQLYRNLKSSSSDPQCGLGMPIVSETLSEGIYSLTCLSY